MNELSPDKTDPYVDDDGDVVIPLDGEELHIQAAALHSFIEENVGEIRMEEEAFESFVLLFFGMGLARIWQGRCKFLMDSDDDDGELYVFARHHYGDGLVFVPLSECQLTTKH
jgi:hypothetical protein